MEARICNPSNQKVKTGGLQIQGQPKLQSRSMSNKQLNKTTALYVCKK